MRISDWSSDVCSSDLSQTRSGKRCDTASDRARRAGTGRASVSLRRHLTGWFRLQRLGAIRLSPGRRAVRSEEHTSELQSLMRISYAVFCLKQKKTKHKHTYTVTIHK